MRKQSEASDDGGSAFPSVVRTGIGTVRTPRFEGMSLRDYFAAKAMEVLVHDRFSTAGASLQDWRDALAHESYSIADAMLAARKAPHA